MKLQKISTFTISHLLLATIFFSCCRPTKECDYIETGPIHVIIYPNSSEYLELNAINGCAEITAQSLSKGIIIFRESRDSFIAYERTCPQCRYNPNSKLIIDPKSRFFISDTTCYTRYIITDGYPLDGPGICPLQEYITNFDGEVLHIFSR